MSETTLQLATMIATHAQHEKIVSAGIKEYGENHMVEFFADDMTVGFFVVIGSCNGASLNIMVNIPVAVDPIYKNYLLRLVESHSVGCGQMH